MSITLTCKCGQEMKVKESSMGKKVRCPGCQEVLTVSPPEEEEQLDDLDEAEDEEEEPAPRKKSRKSHEIDFEIFGDDMQLVQVELDPGEVVIAEAGAMTYMEDDIDYSAKLGDGSDPNQGFFKKMWGAAKRKMTGETMFMTHFTNEGKGKRRVAFAAPYPGKIIPLDLHELGGELICQKDAFLCAAMGTKIDMAFQKKFGAGLFGGEGFILQRLSGDGYIFIHACGTLVVKELEEGETLRVDTGCFVAMTPDVEYNIKKAGSLKSMMFGGEGLFLATLTGPGRIWLQSLPFSRLADRILGASHVGGGTREEGSIFGRLFGMFGGGGD